MIMIKRMKQGAAALLLMCMMTVLLPWCGITVLAATARIAFSDPSAAAGSEFTVKMKITGSDPLSTADVMLSYDAASLEFIEGTNTDGGNGALRVHGDAGAGGASTLAYELKFKALTAGTSQITVKDQEVYDADSKLVTVDQLGQSKVTVTAKEGASDDASLKSLKVSPGTLSPEFSADVETYSVTVGTDVDQLVVSAETTDSDAATQVSGAEGLQMGENRVTVKVTAQDGQTTKEYVIVVTKEEGGASADSQPAAENEAFEMHVSRRSFTVMEPDDTVEVPEGLVPTTITIDDHKVTGWVWGDETEHEYCVIYAMNESGEKGLYRYDLKSSERTIQRYFGEGASTAVSAKTYDLLAGQYDSLRKDYNLFRTLLIAVIVIAIVLVVLLIVSLTGKKERGRRERFSDRKDETEHSRRKEVTAVHSREEEEKMIPDVFEEEEPDDMEDVFEEEQPDEISEEETAAKEEEDDFFDTIDLSFEDEEDEAEPEKETEAPGSQSAVRQIHPRPSEEDVEENKDDFEIFDL